MVVERIKELERKRQEADLLRRAHLQRQKKQEQKLISEESIRRQKLQEGQKKQEHQKTLERQEKTRKLMNDSGIPDEMKRIGKEFLGGLLGIKHDVFVDVDHGKVELAWGNYRKKNGEIDYTFWNGVLDYSYISAQFDVITNSVFINKGKTITQTEWNSDRNLLVEALAKAYLDPLHIKSKDSDHWTRRRPPSSSSSSSSSSECCCH